jgi:hypothetical protein
MNKRTFSLPAIFFIFTITAFAQDPLKVAPQAYKLEFENEWVKVMRVHYGPQEKIPAHDHTELAAAYVYLSDGGPVIFKHIGLAYGAVTRPATKAGSFRLYKAIKEVHEVENPNDTPSDFLRVEFKTDIDAATPLRGKFHRETYSPGENLEKVQFENAQIRVTRLACVKTCEISAGAEPALLIALSPVRLKSSGKGGGLELGKTKWVAAGRKETVENAGQTHAEFLRFDFKTKPVKGDGKEAPHAHPHD